MNKVKIDVYSRGITTGERFSFSIEGELTINQPCSDHDIAARLFAMEFACNNHSEIPLRVHINMKD